MPSRHWLGFKLMACNAMFNFSATGALDEMVAQRVKSE
jgi:hypothetical protein